MKTKFIQIYLFLVIVFTLSGCNLLTEPQEKDNTEEPPDLSITSPLGNYYETNPTLNYTTDAADPVITLNGIPVIINNGDPLTTTITGFNTLSISAASNGVTTTKSVEFFVNKLTGNDLDSFTRADNTTIGNSWIEANSAGDDILSISNNKLVISDSDDADDNAWLGKLYNPSTNSEILEKVQIVSVSGSNIWIDLGIESSAIAGTSISVTLQKADNQYNFIFGEWDSTNSLGNVFNYANNINLDFGNTISMAFYKKNNSYYGLLLSNNQILYKFKKENHTPYQSVNSYDIRRFYIEPRNTNNTGAAIAELDDYGFYL